MTEDDGGEVGQVPELREVYSSCGGGGGVEEGELL